MCVVADSGAVVEHADSGVRAWLIPRPGLFELLGAARRVVQVSAPAKREDLPAALLGRRGGSQRAHESVASVSVRARRCWTDCGDGSRDRDAVQRLLSHRSGR
jgi:hypothetical protein